MEELRNELILGTAQSDVGYSAFQRADPGSWSSIIQKSWELGVTKLDSSFNYIGAHEAIASSGWQGEVHTKVSSLKSAHFELKKSLEVLRRSSVEVLYFHDSRVALESPEKLISVARELLEMGASQIGISVYEPEELLAVLELDEISVIQVPVNPLNQAFLGDLLRHAELAGKRVIARSIFFRGLLLKRDGLVRTKLPAYISDRIGSFKNFCDEVGLSPLEACLRFIHQQNPIVGTVVGAETFEEIDQIVQTWERISSQQLFLDFDQFAISELSDIDLRRLK